MKKKYLAGILSLLLSVTMYTPVRAEMPADDPAENEPEITEIQETEEPEKNGLIESVYEPGFCWQGNVLKKARVGAYRFHD